MQEKAKLNRVIVVKTLRKSNGAVGSRRKGTSGKKATIYQLAADGKTRKETLTTQEGATLKDLSRKLRGTGLLPQHVTLGKDETYF